MYDRNHQKAARTRRAAAMRRHAGHRHYIRRDGRLGCHDCVQASLLLGQMRRRAQSDKQPCSLSLEQVRTLLQTRRCPICLTSLKPRHQGIGQRDDVITMNRLDNARGYVIKNTWAICHRCNRLKNDATPLELRRLADAVTREQMARS